MLAALDNVAVHRGKAGRLRALQAAGFRVPKFVVSPHDLPATLRRLGTPVVVRSSANIEDGDHASLAGQFCSALDLHGIDEVARAIEQCHASIDCEAVRSYCRHHGIDLAAVHMDVIIQRMVMPELAGVAFTVNPLTGAEEIVIEASAGLGDELLSGRKAPLPADDPLVCRYRPLIEDVARGIQRHFGTPQDIEFAIEQGTLYVLQARPITRIGFPADLGEWTNADFRDGGVSSSVCTPLMWSLYDRVWEHSLKGSLGQLHLLGSDFQAGRMFFGRPYWNLGAVKQCLVKLPGFVERQFDEDLSVTPSYEGDGRCTPITLGRLIRAIPTLLAIRRFLNRQKRIGQQALAGGWDLLTQPCDFNRDDIETAFRELAERDYVYLEGNYFRTIFAASLAKLIFKASFPDACFESLTAGLPPLRHMAPVRRAQAMSARTDAALDDLIDEFRHHCRHGLDLCHPRWDEDRDFVRAMLRGLTPSAQNERRAQANPSGAGSPPRRRGRARRSYERKLAELRHFLWLREEMRDLSSRMYWRIRRYVLEIARRHGWGNDVFFMTYREVLAHDTSQVEERRTVYEGYRHFKAPHEIGRAHSTIAKRPARGFQGIAAGPGTARGKAYIARSVEQVMSMPHGAILVCPFIDPGWTPVLDRAAGVVAETGGLLSHAAVICREYGLPAVLGVAGATEGIGQDHWLTVHGSEGRVEISPSEE